MASIMIFKLFNLNKGKTLSMETIMRYHHFTVENRVIKHMYKTYTHTSNDDRGFLFCSCIQNRIRGPQECFPSLPCLRLLHTEHISYPTNRLYMEKR